MPRPRSLSDEAIREIRKWGEKRRALLTRKQMAHKYGVSPGTIGYIADGYQYKRRGLSSAEIDRLAISVTRETTFSAKTHEGPSA